MFSEHCIRTRIIFYNVTSEYDPAFVLLILGFQLRILKMTDIHQCRKMNFTALIPCFLDHFTFVSDFRQLACWNYLLFFLFFLHCCLCIWIFFCLRRKNECVNKIVTIQRIHPFFSDITLMRFDDTACLVWSSRVMKMSEKLQLSTDDSTKTLAQRRAVHRLETRTVSRFREVCPVRRPCSRCFPCSWNIQLCGSRSP